MSWCITHPNSFSEYEGSNPHLTAVFAAPPHDGPGVAGGHHHQVSIVIVQFELITD